MDLEPLYLTLKLSVITTLILLVISLPIAKALYSGRSVLSNAMEAVIGLPLVLPPTVIGFYLLIAFGSQSAFGGWLDQVIGVQVVFSFSGLVIGSLIYSLPFMVYPIVSGFRSVPVIYIEAARVLGKSDWNIFRRVIIPNSKRSVITACILTFAHTVGEFGVVLMIGGNIPRETRVASIAIYDYVEVMNYKDAHLYSAILILISFSVLFSIYLINRKK